MNYSARPASLDSAVCVCGHYFDDHRCAGWHTNTGRIDLAECLDQTCHCTRYAKLSASQRLERVEIMEALER